MCHVRVTRPHLSLTTTVGMPKYDTNTYGSFSIMATVARSHRQRTADMQVVLFQNVGEWRLVFLIVLG